MWTARSAWGRLRGMALSEDRHARHSTTTPCAASTTRQRGWQTGRAPYWPSRAHRAGPPSTATHGPAAAAAPASRTPTPTAHRARNTCRCSRMGNDRPLGFGLRPARSAARQRRRRSRCAPGEPKRSPDGRSHGVARAPSWHRCGEPAAHGAVYAAWSLRTIMPADSTGAAATGRCLLAARRRRGRRGRNRWDSRDMSGCRGRWRAWNAGGAAVPAPQLTATGRRPRTGG